MSELVTLHGYRFSFYNRVARMVLNEKSVAYEIIEVDPFSKRDSAHPNLHPFGRVSVLSHGAFSVLRPQRYRVTSMMPLMGRLCSQRV